MTNENSADTNEEQLPQNQGELLRQLCEEAINDPGKFAVISANMPPQLVHRMHTLLIVTLFNYVAIQSELIQKLQDQITDDGK